MTIPTATLSSKYQISIPKEIRVSMNLKPGQKLAFLCIGKSVSLLPQPRLEDLFGIGKGGDPTGYRDRDTRREDILPKLSDGSVFPAPRQPAVRKAKKARGKVAA
ncbi:MAG: AbrB/MazE/SpoVT family DNA-binding domain-containing protein [Polaromonas sp.]|uniref:AbrB/MazE/SpoVT family DNA-binding domain-containing protein n=1 Tax=Polaromonas sp. TaxID=1869339 RepID=UPI00273644A1|nr:AbrB/MazE/SpoVT family DNA-binding domain-containing protein [Polaromonas sp.]MDP2819130.1 AbrB/MazE/SpoVT family DNA-binding domain-containing protein [Polaromonas sp.]